MASKTVIENVAERDASDGPGVKPKEHPDVVGRPKIVHDPSDKSLVQERFVENVDHVGSEEGPKQNIQIEHTPDSSISGGAAIDSGQPGAA